MKKYWFVRPDCYNKYAIDNAIGTIMNKGCSGCSYYDNISKDLLYNHPNGIYLTIENYKGSDIPGFMPYPDGMKGSSKQWLINNEYLYMGELSRKAKLQKLNKLSEKEILVCKA